MSMERKEYWRMGTGRKRREARQAPRAALHSSSRLRRGRIASKKIVKTIKNFLSKRIKNFC